AFPDVKPRKSPFFPRNRDFRLTRKSVPLPERFRDDVLMPRRTTLEDYAGALGRLSIERVAGLGRRYVAQPKIDGSYVHLHLDSRGRIARVLYRSGLEVSRNLAGHLLGAFVGWPDSVLVGELEAH